MAVIALIKVLDYCSKSLERAREKLADLKQEYAENEANLTSLNEELKTAADRIKELEALKSPTFAEKEELETLKKENAERERQIALLKLEQELKQQEVAEKFVDVMYRDIDSTGEYFVTMDGNIAKQFSS